LAVYIIIIIIIQEISLFQALNTPVGFNWRVYDVATERLGLGTDEVINLIQKGLICQGGHCYDLGDVGSTL